ncbi:MAG: Ldh family oxidoreductase [Inquilinaceae bacterium]
MSTALIDPRAMTRLLDALLRADGCGAEEADAVATHLVEACLSGHDSHGIVRIDRYHGWLKSGVLVARQGLTVLSEGPAFVHLDGGNGMGQWLARQATDRGIAMAGQSGCAVVALRRAGHVGRVGAYAEQACAAGIVSIHFVTVAGSRLVAPFGSSQRGISTAPFAVGVPNAHGDDFVLDFATSMVAEGKALVAARGGRGLPDDALVTADGHLTGDPRVLYGHTLEEGLPDARGGTGALRTMGDHKGSGLALACELLAGALTGGGTNGPTDHPFGNGLLSIYIDPTRFDDLGTFAREAGDYIAFIQSSAPATPGVAVQIPGDKERATRAERGANGIPVPDEVVERILNVAREVGIDVSLDALRHGADARGQAG